MENDALKDNVLEESKIIEIKDVNTTYKFKILLFSVEDGLQFFLKTFNSDGISEEKIEMLLKQAILLNDANPQLNQAFSLQTAKTIFRNPMTIITLALKIKEFQDVFLQDFKI